MVDVVNKRCQHPGCKKRPVFGFEGEKGRFCSLHRSGVSFVPKTLSGIISYIYMPPGTGTIRSTACCTGTSLFLFCWHSLV